MKILTQYTDWLKMQIGEKGYLDNNQNIVIIRVPNGWIYSESYYCEKLDIIMSSNTFIPYN
jgi:hypothetical protein